MKGDRVISRRKRTEALVEGDPLLAAKLARMIEEQLRVEVLSAPRQGLVMCEVRDTARCSRFYMGEALMTECRVLVSGPGAGQEAEGLGAVLGVDEGLVYSLAVIDAACALPGSLECRIQLEQYIENAWHSLCEARSAQDAQTLASRVAFDEMGGQDMSVQAVAK